MFFCNAMWSNSFYFFRYYFILFYYFNLSFMVYKHRHTLVCTLLLINRPFYWILHILFLLQSLSFTNTVNDKENSFLQKTCDILCLVLKHVLCIKKYIIRKNNMTFLKTLYIIKPNGTLLMFLRKIAVYK